MRTIFSDVMSCIQANKVELVSYNFNLDPLIRVGILTLMGGNQHQCRAQGVGNITPQV